MNSDVINHLKNIVWDAHACPTLGGHGDLSSLYEFKKNGFSHVSLNVGFEPNSKIEVINTISYITKFLNQNAEQFKLIGSIEELMEAKKTNKLAISFDIEGYGPFEKDINNIEFFYNLGVRQIAPIYNTTNDLGAGCFETDQSLGLSTDGYEFIEEMNKLGILIDCSHVGYETCIDIIEASTDPIIFSHSNPLGMHNHPRNIHDELIIKSAAKNGVVGLNGINIFLTDSEVDASILVDHIDYLVKLVGADHVGLGLDYVFEHEKTLELVKSNPDQFPNSEQYFNIQMLRPSALHEIIHELLKRAYLPKDIERILGGNFFRVASSVWKSNGISTISNQ